MAVGHEQFASNEIVTEALLIGDDLTDFKDSPEIFLSSTNSGYLDANSEASINVTLRDELNVGNCSAAPPHVLFAARAFCVSSSVASWTSTIPPILLFQSFSSVSN